MKLRNSGAYALERSNMLTAVTKDLEGDERFVAAWLIGSLARKDQDDYSDIDICVVVSGNRVTLIEDGDSFVRKYGMPANIHEAKQNAPEGGTMLSTLYTNGITVDWMLIPEPVAMRPPGASLIFEKVNIPVQNAASKLTPEEKQKQLNDRLTFFWMMAAVAAKSLLRKNAVSFHVFLSMLFGTSEDIAKLLTDSHYHKESDLILLVTPEQQAAGLIKMCEKVVTLSQQSQTPAFMVIKRLLAMIET
jgi:hypothetical protein